MEVGWARGYGIVYVAEPPERNFQVIPEVIILYLKEKSRSIDGETVPI